ncbi:MAG TPA: hypothetical protein VMU90_09555 [Solirubrobacteraceae bacterium]|nr:hypothetical protein [Solirubrobacteraceae bacterium]
MTGEAQLMLVVVGMHFLGLLCAAALLIPALRGSDQPPRTDSGDDGWGNQRPPTSPPPDRPGPGVPLPDAVPARVRLRDHDRLPDVLPRRPRRPAREPARQPTRTPVQ